MRRSEELPDILQDAENRADDGENALYDDSPHLRIGLEEGKTTHEVGHHHHTADIASVDVHQGCEEEHDVAGVAQHVVAYVRVLVGAHALHLALRLTQYYRIYA